MSCRFGPHLSHQDAIGLASSPSYAPSQLVQLGQTIMLGIQNHQDCGIGHVQTHFDHRGREKNIQVFEVATWASKHQIKEAVEKIFKVKVINVNVMNVPGKLKAIGRRRTMTPSYKKAVVTLGPGDKIVYFEGV